MNDHRGSKWRKWDLHVHTPESLQEQFKATEHDDIWEAYIKDLEQLPQEFQVIGINDYIFLDGYRKVLEYKALGRLKNIQLILPVIEFRIRKFSGHKQFKRINLHVIFSDEISPDIIQSQFLNTLSANYKLSPGHSPSLTWSGIVTKESLTDLGAKIKASVPTAELVNFGSDLQEGFNNLNCDEDQIIEYLYGNSYFSDKFLIAIGKTEWDALNWGESSIAEKKDIINKSQIVFTSAESIESFHKAKNKLLEQQVNHLLLDCSDAHHNSNSVDKDRIGKCFTWIKADPSFDGLKQIINEPDRVFVGDIPPLLNRINTNPTKFIERLSINKITDSTLTEPWFDGIDIKFNAGLVAIIGNKGNGKSALADIISLCGNTHNAEHFSFLHKDKFRKSKPVNKAQQFDATITWRNGTSDLKNLNAVIDKGLTEKVKYIPQNFLETLCTPEEGDAFERELRKIIFSHTPHSERIGATSLDELIKNKSEIIESDISKIKNKITVINKLIVALSLKKSVNYRKTIEGLLEQKKAELDAHIKNKPIEVLQPPVSDTEQKGSIRDQVFNLRNQIVALEEQIRVKSDDKLQLNISINELNKSLQSVTSLSDELNNFKERENNILNKYGINIDELFSYEIKSFIISDKIAEKRNELTELNNLLDIFVMGNLYEQKVTLESSIKVIQDQLDAPMKIYQKYLDDYRVWQVTENLIKGNINVENTLYYFEEIIRYIDNDLTGELDSAKAQRRMLLKTLYDKKNEIIELYKQLFTPVSEFISSYGQSMESYNIQFDVSFQLQGFYEKFFDHINLASKGSFSGKEDGYKRLQQIVESSDLNTSEGFIGFLNLVVGQILKDKREGQNDSPRSIDEQLKKGYEPLDFYNFLFSLDYLVPIYKLKLGDKDLSELSPGERGALLLIFYLILDNDDIPLVIDQPEENLDNQSVYTILVQFIKEVKDRRQIFIVTHNPNLAVVCDAEQIIYIKIAKDESNRVTCLSGAIENPQINGKLIEILEGTFPAFDNRTAKYKVTKR